MTMEEFISQCRNLPEDYKPVKTSANKIRYYIDGQDTCPICAIYHHFTKEFVPAHKVGIGARYLKLEPNDIAQIIGCADDLCQFPELERAIFHQ